MARLALQLGCNLGVSSEFACCALCAWLGRRRLAAVQEPRPFLQTFVIQDPSAFGVRPVPTIRQASFRQNNRLNSICESHCLAHLRLFASRPVHIKELLSHLDCRQRILAWVWFYQPPTGFHSGSGATFLGRRAAFR